MNVKADLVTTMGPASIIMDLTHATARRAGQDMIVKRVL